MIKFLIYLSLLLGFQLANAQSENAYYKIQDGDIVTHEQLDERIEMIQKLSKL